tara:strand:- start:80469 stop:81275 length:807 start_codon:yes stop_codon:yes gene_type:complete
MEKEKTLIKADFNYRNPLKEGEKKPAFGLSAPDPKMPDHKSFLKVVEDARNGIHSFQEEGFKLLNHESKVVDFYDDELVSQVYYQEIHDLVKRETKADLIQILPHITRNEAEAASGKRLGAHRLVHNDFTPQFDEIIKEFLTNLDINPKRTETYNLWRRFDKDGLDAPFAVCDARSVTKEELIPTDLHNYGDGEGFAVEIYQSSYSKKHKWHFFSKMNKNEVLMFKTYDSSRNPFLPTLHSAFDDPRVLGKEVAPRESIEVRAICFYL